MIRAIIVEDEKRSRETLKNLLDEFCKDIEVVGMAGSVDEAVAEILEKKPDLLFLDIELQSGTGFDVLEKVKHQYFEIIFTTAFEHYAIKAIKISSIDYLLKPIDIEELENAIEKVRNKKDQTTYKQQLEILLNNVHKKPDENRKICVSTADGIEFLKVYDIIYCEASGSYTTIYLKNRDKLLLSKHLKEYENLLSDYEFMRVHNSYLVNLQEVKSFVKSDGGYILMNNNAQISISQKNVNCL
ncbi:MAG: response regulator transcription factor [Chloroflexia bacterium]|nr:response regulator transcription factor [Chloroflexia bacterium]